MPCAHTWRSGWRKWASRSTARASQGRLGAQQEHLKGVSEHSKSVSEHSKNVLKGVSEHSKSILGGWAAPRQTNAVVNEHYGNVPAYEDLLKHAGHDARVGYMVVRLSLIHI